jgi:hypothetical protein
MENKGMDLWQEDGDAARVTSFFTALEAAEDVRERIRAKTLNLAQKPMSRRLPRLKLPRLRYIAAACLLVLVCAALLNAVARGLDSGALEMPFVKWNTGSGANAAPAVATADSTADSFFGAAEEMTADRLDETSVADRDSAPADEAYNIENVYSPNKIIYAMNAQLRVNDIGEAMRGLEEQARKSGGYVAASRQSNQENRQSGSLTLRIPAEAFMEFTNSLDQWGTVTDKYIFSDDVTEQYMDKESRLKSWQTQEDRYLEFFSSAKTVEEMIMIENALNEVRREKEALEGRLKYWDSKISYSDVNLELTQQRTEAVVSDPWQPASFARTLEAAKNAVIKTVSVAWNGFNNFVVFLGYALPALIILALFCLGLRVWLQRRGVRRRAALAEATRTEKRVEE